MHNDINCMRKKILTLLLIAFAGFNLNAQKIYFPDENFGKGKVKVGSRNLVDTAKWEVIYVHVARDAQNDQQKAYCEMLSVGDKYTWYGGYGNFQVDSIQNANPDYFTVMNGSDFINTVRDYERIKDEMIIDRSIGIITYAGNVGPGENYIYQENVPDIDWELLEGTEDILGYTCGKAKATWRGREWTAWYCDIPESIGPWKFNGLPGLILKLSDKSGEQMFIAEEIRKYEYSIGLGKGSPGKTTREKFNAAFRNYCENVGKIWANSGMIKGETAERLKNSRKFFSPIELE